MTYETPYVGTAVLQQDAEGVITVLHADPMILITQELLDSAECICDGPLITFPSVPPLTYRVLRPVGNRTVLAEQVMSS